MTENNTTLKDVPEDADLVLTTIDNPYDPKQDYLKWKQWDEESGYYTEAYLARMLMMEPDFDIDDDLKIFELTNKVVNDILENDPREIYKLT
jgi:hypothetical protein